MAQPRRKAASPPRPLAVPGVSSRPAWQGQLRLSLVSCPVGLFRATTTANDVSFHLINPDTGNRIKMVTTDPETGPVERSSLVKGYEVDKGEYVLFDEEELSSVKLETTRTLDIERFVDADSIDRLYWDEPYILVPAEGGAEAYGVIQQAMVKARKIALGRVTMHTRERLMAIEPRDNGLLATTLRMRDEVVNTTEALSAIPAGKVDAKMIDIAARIIEQQEGAFDPEEFIDRYENALRDLINEKKRGRKITRSAEPAKDSNVVDLMDALKRSLQNGGKKSSAKSEKPKPQANNVRKLPERKPVKRKTARR